jgi:hypothetical protein
VKLDIRVSVSELLVAACLVFITWKPNEKANSSKTTDVVNEPSDFEVGMSIFSFVRDIFG